MSRPASLWRGERGDAAAVELVLWSGLILLPAVMLVISLPTWWERQSLGRLAAQQAARTVVSAEHWDAGVARADQLVAQLAANHQVPAGDLQLIAVEGSLVRGDQVTATTTVTVPAAHIPLLGSLPGFTLTHHHAEQVDIYRSLPSP